MASRAEPFSRPVRMAMRIPAASQSGAMVEKCWRARISVGAMIAAWQPASIAVAIAISATMVLPEPTSPCNRRIMRSGLPRSAMISPSAAFLCRHQLVAERGKDARGQFARSTCATGPPICASFRASG